MERFCLERQLRLKGYDFECKCRACELDFPLRSEMPRGLRPLQLASNTDDEVDPEDILPPWLVIDSNFDARDFLQQVGKLQRIEKDLLKGDGTPDAWLELFKQRSDVLEKAVGHPHLCHLKTRLGVATWLWRKFGSTEIEDFKV